MTRVVQKRGERGSLKWLQIAVAEHRHVLEEPIRSTFSDIGPIEWLSPLATDEFAEYRDAAFLERLGLPEAADALQVFWPRRGPQWDALACSGDVKFLFEAKAHLPEAFSAPSQASNPDSVELIRSSLSQAIEFLSANPIAPWDRAFYQYANRIAHLFFLRQIVKVDARMVFIDFVGDAEMGGPEHPAAWEGAYAIIDHVLGLRRRHRLSRYMTHIHPDVRLLAT